MSKRVLNPNEEAFNNARRLLFGEELIPAGETGADGKSILRPRWTTAGALDTNSNRGSIEFTLGPFTFTFKNLRGETIIRFQTNGKNDINELGTIRNNLFYIGDISSFCFVRGGISREFIYNGGLYFKSLFAITTERNKNTDLKELTSFSDIPLSFVPIWESTCNYDFNIDFAGYIDSKYRRLAQISILKKGDTIKPGFYQKEGYSVQIDPQNIEQANLTYTIAVSGKIPYSVDNICHLIIGKNAGVVSKAELKDWLKAADWIFHLLRGPDLRTYQSPGYQLIPEGTPRKETLSDPPSNFSIIKRDGVDTLDIPGGIPILVADSTPITRVRAEEIYNEVLIYLRGIANNLAHRDVADTSMQGFSNIYSVFVKSNPNEHIVLNGVRCPFTRGEFEAAQKRIDRFIQHEFLGCNVCDKMASLKCSKCGVPHCGEVCFQTHTCLV